MKIDVTASPNENIDIQLSFTKTLNVASGRFLLEMERLLQSLDVFNLDYRAALRAAKISGGLERKGIGIDPFDSLVAAIALVNGADSLITRNVSHFDRIDELKTETH